MREVVGTGTDVAAVAIGDPTLLEALRACGGRRYEVTRDAAVAEGRLWRTETGADGSYLFHVFVDADPPADLAPYLFDPIEVERFHVPSGRLLVGGEECFVGALDPHDHPHMGREIAIPPGEYRLTALRGETPEGLLDERFEAVSTLEERAAWKRGNSLPTLGVVGTIAAVVTAYFVYLRSLSAGVALLPLMMAIVAWYGIARYRRGAAYQAAQQRFRALELEYPSIVLVLRRHDG